LMLGKIPQLIGFAEFHRNRMLGRASRLIEHKGPADMKDGTSDTRPRPNST
jgi:hypothetical protein